jgi:FkbM family methyltransferase
MEKPFFSMKPKEFLLRSIRRLIFLNQPFQSLIRFMVARENLRKKLNKFYNRLNEDEKAVFHNLTSKAFTDGNREISDGVWVVEFLGKQIRLPLRNDKLWLDWDNAVSIVGHDPDVKSTYELLIKSDHAPRRFFDVGANYGTHTLLFLSQGIEAVAFEPNPACKKEFEEFCRLNKIDGKMEAVAIGAENKTVDFWFPKRETWLGTLVDTTKDFLSQNYDLEKIKVSLITMDEYTQKTGLNPDLIKIDTEGNELSVIRGAVNTITSHRPLIIFEANHLSNRKELWEVFKELKYTIAALPLESLQDFKTIPIEKFLVSKSNNFIALPNKHFIK